MKDDYGNEGTAGQVLVKQPGGFAKWTTPDKSLVNPPYFVIDGAEGVGKTTYMPKLKAFLEAKGYEVVMVREPGETVAGKVLRKHVLDKERELEEETQCFLGDRILTQQQVVLPALRAGKVVISDRSLLCTGIYQGQMKDPSGERLKKILDIHASFRDFLYPTMGFIAQVPFDVARARIAERSENNHIDLKPAEWHRQLMKEFDTCYEWAPFPVKYTDFNFSEDEADKIHEQIYAQIVDLLPTPPVSFVEKNTVTQFFKDWMALIEKSKSPEPSLGPDRYPEVGTMTSDLGEVYFITDVETGQRNMVLTTPTGEIKTYNNIELITKETEIDSPLLNLKMEFSVTKAPKTP